MVDEDATHTPLADDIRAPPFGRFQSVEHGQHPAGGPAVVGEQPADLVSLHRCSSKCASSDSSSADRRISRHGTMRLPSAPEPGDCERHESDRDSRQPEQCEQRHPDCVVIGVVRWTRWHCGVWVAGPLVVAGGKWRRRGGPQQHDRHGDEGRPGQQCSEPATLKQATHGRTLGPPAPEGKRVLVASARLRWDCPNRSDSHLVTMRDGNRPLKRLLDGSHRSEPGARRSTPGRPGCGVRGNQVYFSTVRPANRRTAILN